MEKKQTHGGKREGAGRKASLFPAFLKEFRATKEEQAEFIHLLPGDAREDFLQIMRALHATKSPAEAGQVEQ